MLNISKTLDKLGISNSSYVAAVRDVREHLQDKSPVDFLKKVFDIDVDFNAIAAKTSNVDAAACCTIQYMIDTAVRNNCDVGDAEMLFSQAMDRTALFVNDPTKKWMFVTDETVTTSTSSKVNQLAVKKVVEGSSVTVAVNDDGKIRKGGKGPAAEALYKQYVVDSKTPLDNKAFKQLLMTQLQMTEAGSNTYLYNCRKKFSQ